MKAAPLGRFFYGLYHELHEYRDGEGYIPPNILKRGDSYALTISLMI